MTILTLASGSEIRARLLRQAHVAFDTIPARVDEDQIKESMIASGAPSRDIADALAEAKARKVAMKQPQAMVLGCDQVLDFDGQILSKPKTQAEAVSQLNALSGQKHMLFSAAVIYDDAKPVWRHVGVVRLWVRALSEAWIDDYVERNWDSIQHSVGGYKLEEEGVRIFTRIEGDHFNVLGLPLLELLSYLTLRGSLSS